MSISPQVAKIDPHRAINSLEAVASRIEDVADIQEQRSYSAIGASASNSSQASSAVPAPPPPPPPPPPTVAPALAAVEEPKFITAFDDAVIKGKLKPFIELSNSFAGDSVKEQVSSIRGFLIHGFQG